MLKAGDSARPAGGGRRLSVANGSISALLALLALLAMLPAALLKAQNAPPAYEWKNVVIHGGGFVSGVIFSPAKRDLAYARTDVGGAYRSEDAGKHWAPITDSIGRDDSNSTGIESLALDPQDADKVYIAAGLYTGEWAPQGAIFRSSDQGRTWQRAGIPAKMGGNEDGRNCGERLAVDPHSGSVLYFGSRHAGLWKSADSGATWARVTSFPVQESVTGAWQKGGISFVAFDRAAGSSGSPSPSIYVGVAQAGASLYRSDDAGATWSLLPGAPNDMFPCHVSFGSPGEVYFSYIDNLGPNGITNGAILKYTIKTGKWQNVSPVLPGTGDLGKFGFGGLTSDPEHPDTLMATTIDRWWPGDLIYRTTDGGKHWKELHSDAVYSAQDTPWAYHHKDKTGGTGWMTDIAIDPYDPSNVIYTTGAGLWNSSDVTAADKGKPTHWGFDDEGLEETVPITLISPPEGAHLISGVGDIGGFRHDDLAKSPAGGFFEDPVFSNTDKLDFAGQKPSVVVRVGRGSDKIVHGAYSLNGGDRWAPFAGEPPTSTHGSGSVAISADGSVVIWTPDKGFAFWTSDMGRTWNSCSGMGKGMTAVADTVNPDKFYSFDADTGKLYESFDKGQVFKERLDPIAPRSSRVSVKPAPGIEGDLWVIAADSLYHSTDSGVTFTKSDDISKALAIGFGKPAPGQSYPAIYLVARRGSVDGIFRSDDGGKQWLRINDDSHQFGWIHTLTGDPRIYGRVYLATSGRGIVYGDLAEPAGAATVQSAQ
jgi:photosystem II stability/assembly factor-like uncharacterized protein